MQAPGGVAETGSLVCLLCLLARLASVRRHAGTPHVPALAHDHLPRAPGARGAAPRRRWEGEMGEEEEARRQAALLALEASEGEEDEAAKASDVLGMGAVGWRQGGAG